jgi:pantothenate kinase
VTSGTDDKGLSSHSAIAGASPSGLYLDSLELITDQILALRANSAVGTRVLIGIAGAPGSGKSTLATSLVELLNQRLAAQDESAVVVPMDGFHLDNEVLDILGTRSVKGSPPTFDVAGFVSLLRRIAIKSEQSVYVPVFDRTLDLARNAAQEITTQHSIAVVEGNYLLLGRPVWCEIIAMLDSSLMLEVPLSTLEARLIQRWLDHGHTLEEARARALSNDIPNAHVVLKESISADLYYKSVRQ